MRGKCLAWSHEGAIRVGAVVPRETWSGDTVALLTDPAKVQLVMMDGVIYQDCTTPVLAKAALLVDFFARR